MDENFNMQKDENKHKVEQTQFQSAAGEEIKSVESNIKEKRRTSFDILRNLPKCEMPVDKPLSKAEQRRNQLQKWKEEKEKKRAMALAQKKQPFLVGKVKVPLKYEPPPPVLRPLPSTSRGIKQSQATRDKASNKKQEQAPPYSFAPENASFNPKLDDLPMKMNQAPVKVNETVQDLITLKPPNHVPKCESSSEEKFWSPKSPITLQSHLSREKENLRKELKKRFAEATRKAKQANTNDKKAFKACFYSKLSPRKSPTAPVAIIPGTPAPTNDLAATSGTSNSNISMAKSAENESQDRVGGKQNKLTSKRKLIRQDAFDEY